jgi:hypothetical protein
VEGSAVRHSDFPNSRAKVQRSHADTKPVEVAGVMYELKLKAGGYS